MKSITGEKILVSAIGVLVLAIVMILTQYFITRDTTTKIVDKLHEYGEVKIEVNSEKKVAYYFDGDNTLSEIELKHLHDLSSTYEIIYFRSGKSFN